MDLHWAPNGLWKHQKQVWFRNFLKVIPQITQKSAHVHNSRKSSFSLPLPTSPSSPDPSIASSLSTYILLLGPVLKAPCSVLPLHLCNHYFSSSLVFPSGSNPPVCIYKVHPPDIMNICHNIDHTVLWLSIALSVPFPLLWHLWASVTSL